MSIVKNGGFENDYADWNTYGRGDPAGIALFEINAADPYAGAKSARVRAAASTATITAWLSQKLDPSLFTPGKGFQVSYAQRGYGDRSAELDFIYQGGAVKEFVNYGMPQATSWLQGVDNRLVGVAPDVFDSVVIMFAANGYIGSDALLELDEVDVQVEAAPTPTGILAVSTSPIAGQIYVDGSLVGTGSYTATYTVGQLTVSFGDVAGYYTPLSQTVQILENQTTTVDVVYSPITAPPPSGVIPEPGSPYKWLALRWSVYGGFSGSRNPVDYMPRIIDLLHPGAIQYRCPEDFWYNNVWSRGWYETCIKYASDMSRICKENNIVLMTCVSNSENGNVGLGAELYDPTVFPADAVSFQQLLHELLSAINPKPLWLVIDTEVTKPSPAEAADPALLRQHVYECKAICESYGVNFGIHQIYLSRGFEIFNNELPWGLDTNYPLRWGAVDGVDFIRYIDNRPYGFMMKIGILSNEVIPYWTEESILNIYNTVDETEKCVLPFLDLVDGMLDPVQCPDFVPVVTREATARGYITSLTVPPPTPISPPWLGLASVFFGSVILIKSIEPKS
jgi:hypothetical protein